MGKIYDYIINNTNNSYKLQREALEKMLDQKFLTMSIISAYRWQALKKPKRKKGSK